MVCPPSVHAHTGSLTRWHRSCGERLCSCTAQARARASRAVCRASRAVCRASRVPRGTCAGPMSPNTRAEWCRPGLFGVVPNGHPAGHELKSWCRMGRSWPAGGLHEQAAHGRSWPAGGLLMVACRHGPLVACCRWWPAHGPMSPWRHPQGLLEAQIGASHRSSSSRRHHQPHTPCLTPAQPIRPAHLHLPSAAVLSNLGCRVSGVPCCGPGRGRGRGWGWMRRQAACGAVSKRAQSSGPAGRHLQ